jgi:hypothetical protein
LAEVVTRVGRDQRHHLGLVLSDSPKFGEAFTDVTIARDDQPTLLGDDRDPVLILDVDTRDNARRPQPLVQLAARVTRLGHVGADLSEQDSQPADVGIEIELDVRWLGPAHAARAARLACS